MIEWKDETSYSQGERIGEVEPRTWAATVAGIRVGVTRYMRIENEWFLSCRDLGFPSGDRALGPDLELARGKALELVSERARERYDQLERFLDAIGRLTYFDPGLNRDVSPGDPRYDASKVSQ